MSSPTPQSSSNIPVPTTVDPKLHSICQNVLEKVMLRNPKIHKLVDAIEELGCKLPSNFISCRSCGDGEISGGFIVASTEDGKKYEPKIIMCENNLMEIETFENTVVHELVHAYDVCRAKIDFTKCVQHACTEIRASSLSGECGILHEAFRGHFKIQGGHQECSKRRATLSVGMNPNCKEVAAKAVEAAFAKCYADRKPFDDDE